ncbi:hypothetical protein TPHA_0A04620 [Tetrapisispora phaffii CBS 4417]|uniref:Pseudouridine synthase RsuA/RluA-like domain-containing protein n=1 Tax=Tetrapisispora phaffii (strain ATCC 24235 / CBS 4417 / NBRC 1672 / NRRL Y-8282 / UCD 70-5) TaxID=1071381 RepID=G8BNQ7_TETPH|nr:hypothetical protein TPHA_0A04620 [Tetrapisispora phaffii CBS 4417]CCE61535.1 hypothetical protein TPHA_0A04620 [Tetrapisispora phaffii CBS 4417]
MPLEVVYTNGLRKLKPYYSTRNTFAKGRWLGKTLLEVLVKEFKTFTEQHYIDGITKGLYTIYRDGELLAADDVLHSRIQNKDIVETRFHKHEPPVKQWCTELIENNDRQGRVAGIDLIYEDDNLFIIDKPNGIPVHPTGQFYKNTLTEIFKTHGKTVSPCYRIDKVTSGLLIFAKNQVAASDIQTKISERTMNKYYFARVKGKFPGTLSNIFGDSYNISDIIQQDPVIENSSIYTVELKKGSLAAFSPTREAVTHFYPIKYYPDCDHSVVLCKPLTGRTHQIRIHLARLGFPIVNDPFYNINNTKFRRRSKFLLDYKERESIDKLKLQNIFNQFVEETAEQKSNSISNEQGSKCLECGINLLDDSSISELEIYLHAWCYSNKDNTFEYKTKIPEWA